jgi:hypothetical protein
MRICFYEFCFATACGARWMLSLVQKLMNQRVSCVMLPSTFSLFIVCPAPLTLPPPPPPPSLSPLPSEPQPKLSFSLLDGTFDEHERSIYLFMRALVICWVCFPLFLFPAAPHPSPMRSTLGEEWRLEMKHMMTIISSSSSSSSSSSAMQLSRLPVMRGRRPQF